MAEYVLNVSTQTDEDEKNLTTDRISNLATDTRRLLRICIASTLSAQIH